MELKITGTKQNNLLNRKEVTAEVHEKTIPSRQQVREKMSAMLNTKPEDIAVVKTDTKFGSSKAIIFARVYASNEALKKTEPKYVRERNFGKEKKAEAASGEAAPPANFKK
ncbi:30S ribosomal protein S24e [uncultured archaeon]|nr:30S ribosomal protein S24e [uncultured archaeon]